MTLNVVGHFMTVSTLTKLYNYCELENNNNQILHLKTIFIRYLPFTHSS